MLLVKYSNLDVKDFINKYNDKVKLLVPNKTDDIKQWLIKFIEEVKTALANNSIVFIDYIKELVLSFNVLKIEYKIIYPKEISLEEYNSNKEEYDSVKLQSQNVDSIIIDEEHTLENMLKNYFDWIVVDADKKLNAKSDSNTTTDVAVMESRKPLTFKELVENDDLEITDADIRDMKALTNKFKMTMILQAKSRLKTVLKLCNVLDKLYEELVDRIDNSLDTTDTASLMYTADYISKALSETNQFIMPLINNEKLQNFFIIDNSSVINISDSRVDINKREKVRKAAEIVLDNLDYFVNGDFNNIINPNEVVADDKEYKDGD